MTDPTDRTPDRPDESASTSTDLAVLMSHPSLTSLKRQGWQLDRLSTTSTAWAFAGTLLISMIAFGAMSAFLVVVMAVLAVGATAYALVTDDLRSARGVLLLSRVCLLVWVLTGTATLLASPSDASAPSASTTVSTSLAPQAPARPGDLPAR